MRVFVEVFRTNVRGRRAAGAVLRGLRARWPTARITFDLADSDRILRIQHPTAPVEPARVAAMLAASGYLCEPLPDDDEEAASVGHLLCSLLNNSAK